MLRWILLLPTVALFALSWLTVMKSPDWAPWRLTVVAGEYGHWFAPLALLTAGVAWWGQKDGIMLAGLTAILGVSAALLLIKPCIQAARIAPTLPEQLTRE